MYKIIGSADPKFLAASDVLIGDMSNINYEYLLFNRPIILLANEWVDKNYPDIGIKSKLENLGSNIDIALTKTTDFSRERKFWLEQSISLLPESSSSRYVSLMIKYSGLVNPEFHLIWGGNTVRMTNIEPLLIELKKKGYTHKLFKNRKDYKKSLNGNVIIVAAHFKDLWEDVPGYKVHIDHDLKGIATANIEYARKDYLKNNYFPHINLHITTGNVGNIRTMYVLGPNSNRAIIGGYPKADTLLALEGEETKRKVCEELDLSPALPLICYAPAGERSFMKPGGSLSNIVLMELGKLASFGKYNILVKTKYGNNMTWLKNRLKYIVRYRSITQDDGHKWRAMRDEILDSKF